MLTRACSWIVVAAYLVLGMVHAQAATTILPPGETCFQRATGPVSSGSVYMLTPNTTTPKNTWQDSGQTILNPNPIPLDANGCAIIYGTGSYRQQVYTGPVVGGLPSGSLLYDVTTADTSSFQSVFWAGLSGGTPNAVTVTDASFNNTDGSVINFLALNSNTGATTLSVSGAAPVAIKAPSTTGPIAITASCIVANNPVSVVYSSSAAAFILLTPCQGGAGGAATSAIVPPGGYLTLSSDTNNIIITGDTTGATTVFYTPYTSNQVPIWNGTSYTLYNITQLQLNLNAGQHLGNTIYDVCVFLNSSVPTLAAGPAWSNSAVGAGARGSGGGSAQISRLNGLWVNTVQITGTNGGGTATIPANQCTILGTILIDQTAGTISNYLSAGQNRKWGVWNFYNRQPIALQVTDPTASWTYTSITRASNGTIGNAATVLTGLAEESIMGTFNQVAQTTDGANPSYMHNGIGFNSSTTYSGQQGALLHSQNSTTITDTLVASGISAPVLGANNFISLEDGVRGSSAGSAGQAFRGTTSNMLMALRFRG
jgi:hypothetical protein